KPVMLNSTHYLAFVRSMVAVCQNVSIRSSTEEAGEPSRRAAEIVLRGGCFLAPLDHLDVDHDQQNPNSSQNYGDAREEIAGPRTESAGTADTTERPSETASFAALNEHEEDQHQADDKHH